MKDDFSKRDDISKKDNVSKITTKDGAKEDSAIAVAKQDICTHCCKVVANKDPSLLCEVCDLWYHMKCQNINKSEYKFCGRPQVSKLVLCTMSQEYDTSGKDGK